MGDLATFADAEDDAEEDDNDMPFDVEMSEEVFLDFLLGLGTSTLLGPLQPRHRSPHHQPPPLLPN
jgi:hypothetical protein